MQQHAATATAATATATATATARTNTLQNQLKHKFNQKRAGSCTSQMLIIETITSLEFDFAACMNVPSQNKSELSTEEGS